MITLIFNRNEKFVVSFFTRIVRRRAQLDSKLVEQRDSRLAEWLVERPERLSAQQVAQVRLVQLQLELAHQSPIYVAREHHTPTQLLQSVQTPRISCWHSFELKISFTIYCLISSEFALNLKTRKKTQRNNLRNRNKTDSMWKNAQRTTRDQSKWLDKLAQWKKYISHLNVNTADEAQYLFDSRLFNI